MAKPLFSRWQKLLVMLVLGAFITAACGSQSAAPEQVFVEVERVVPVEAPEAAPAYDAAGEMASEEAFRFARNESNQVEQRIVIKNANLSIVVDDPAASMDEVSRIAEELGGWVVSANLYQTRLENGAQVPRASITIRVPAEQLDQVIDQISAFSDQDPISQNINSQDVTSDYTDLQSRLRNLEAAEQQLTEIMDAAVKTEDVMNVFNQLVQVREQIEVIKGQIQYYEQSAALSSLSVELIPNEAVQPLTIGSWQPVGVAKDAIQALINTLKFLANAVIWIVLLMLPVALVLYLVLFLPFSRLWRAWRKRRTQRKEETTAQEKEE